MVAIGMTSPRRGDRLATAISLRAKTVGSAKSMASIEWKMARVASFLLYYSGGLRIFEHLDRRRRSGPRCTVIVYHRIAWTPLGYHDVCVSPGRFRDHLEYMVRHGYAFLSLEQYQEYLAGRLALDRDSVVVSFDDGYRDNYTAAFPLLKELGIPAAVFLCTGPLETGDPLWWDRIGDVVRECRRVGVRSTVADPDVPAPLAAVFARALVASDRRASAEIGRLVDLVKGLSTPERERTVAALERQAPLGDASSPMLTWDMVREMHAAGITFCAHSVTHPDFSRLAPEEARGEIGASKRSIEDQLGVPMTAFAYPYGKQRFFNASTIDALRENGFHWAYTTENGVNDPHTSPYALRRDGMRDVPAYVLAVRLAGVFEHPMLDRLRSRIERHGVTSKKR